MGKQDHSEKNRRLEKSYPKHDTSGILLGAKRCVRQIDRGRNKYHEHRQEPDCEDPSVSTTQHEKTGARRKTEHIPPPGS